MKQYKYQKLEKYNSGDVILELDAIQRAYNCLKIEDNEAIVQMTWDGKNQKLIIKKLVFPKNVDITKLNIAEVKAKAIHLQALFKKVEEIDFVPDLHSSLDKINYILIGE